MKREPRPPRPSELMRSYDRFVDAILACKRIETWRLPRQPTTAVSLGVTLTRRPRVHTFFLEILPHSPETARRQDRGREPSARLVIAFIIPRGCTLPVPRPPR